MTARPRTRPRRSDRPGRIPLREGAALTLPLSKNGENRFKVFVFDPAGGAIPLANDLIAVTRTAATVEAIPASHSIGVAAKAGSSH